MKQCTRCGEWKPLEDFHARSEKKDGRRAACATCVSWSKRASTYDLSPSELEGMLDEIGWACEICNASLDQGLHVDHDHNTGQVRGILCRGCNIALGHMEDSPERLEAAAAYLRVDQ